MLAREIASVKTSLVHTELNLEDILNSAKKLSDRLYVNRQLQEVMKNEYKDNRDIYRDYSSLSFLEDYQRSYTEVDSFRIYTENLSLLDNSFIIKASDQIKKERWYEKAVLMKGQPYWCYKADSVSKKQFLSLIRSIWSTQDGSFVGVLVINIDSEVIAKMLRNQNYDAAIALSNNISFSSFTNDNHAEIRQLGTVLHTHEHNSDKLIRIRWNNAPAELMAVDYYPTYSTDLCFTIMYIINMRQLVLATRAVTIPTTILLVILYILSFILLNQVYNTLIEKEQIFARQNEMRYKMLATQINPHFLFNTLETIRMKSLATGDKDVSTMLKLLASLLRYNLSVSGKEVPLIKELEAIQNYLNIQHIRFGDRIAYDIVTLSDVNRISILPLLIQPIVENSFSHGLESKEKGGFIYIWIGFEPNEKGENLFTISVKDNGSGIEPEQLDEINRKLENEISEDYNNSIGLVNVNSRIKLFYGKDYGMKIFSEKGKGTEVKLTFPIQE